MTPTHEELLSNARAVAERTRSLREQAAALAETQRALQEANQRFADLYDFVPVAYLIVSNLGIIQHANEAALQMFGGEREWVVGRPLIGYVDTADMRRVLDGVLSSGQSFSQSMEIRLRAREGFRVAQMITRRAFHDHRQPATYHIAMVDLTEIRRLEAAQRQADEARQESLEAERVTRAASDAKDEFLAMLSHELRTPLTPILAAAETLLAHGTISPELAASLEIIRRNVRSEARLIDDLLDVARITRNKLEIRRRPIDLHRVIADTVDGWGSTLEQHRLKSEVELNAAEHWIDGDAGRLGQVLRNVVANAVKFTEADGHISVRTDEQDGRIRVTIADTGAGMTGAQLEGLFTPFVRKEQRSARGGLGLGLVISHAIVEAHGGTLSISSAGPGNGTTVVIELTTIPAPAMQDVDPTAAPMETAATSRPVLAGLPAAPTRVLIVEDDPDSAEMLAMMLSFEGYQVQIARSLHQARAMAECCEIVVSDIALPDGSGLDLIRAIHQQKPMRAIAMSGYGSRDDVQRSLEAGFEEHLTKPVDLERLVAAVRRLSIPRV